MSTRQTQDDRLHLALPKGRMQAGVIRLLEEAGIAVQLGSRQYRPSLSLAGVEVKLLKPQNIIEMLHLGSRDIGFAGADWVAELRADLVELLDTDLDPVQLVVAAPEALLREGALPARPLIVASEYERLTRDWVRAQGIKATFLRSYGATEVFPPEDADCIVDNTATGATLTANRLRIIESLMSSSTRLYAHPRALDDRIKRERIEDLRLLLQAVLEARQRVMVEVNIAADRLEPLIDALPCMRRPTVAPLHGNHGYAVKAAVARRELPRVLPELKARGATDLVVTQLHQIVP